jgi:hypothetical protein
MATRMILILFWAAFAAHSVRLKGARIDLPGEQ